MGKDKVNEDKRERIKGGKWKRQNRVPNSMMHELQWGNCFCLVLRIASLRYPYPNRSLAYLIGSERPGSSGRRSRSFKQRTSKSKGTVL